MPEASAASVACSPVSRKRMKSLGSRSCASRAAASGSCRRSQSSLGAWKPVLARLPVIAITPLAPDPRGRSRRTRRACARRSRAAPGGSAHRRGRGTPSRASARRARRAAMAWPCAAAVAAAARSTVACHQSSGSCSVQPGRGVSSGIGRRRRARARAPSAARSTPLAPLVPISMPMVAGCGPWPFLASLSIAWPDFTPPWAVLYSMRPLCGQRPPHPSTRLRARLCPSPIPRATPSSIWPCPRAGWRRRVMRLLTDAGIRLTFDRRGYRPTISLDGFETKILKPQNIVEMLHLGSRDLGFAGADWVVEKGAELVELLDTGARSGADRGRGGARLPRRRPPGQPGFVVATEYERITARLARAPRLRRPGRALLRRHRGVPARGRRLHRRQHRDRRHAEGQRAAHLRRADALVDPALRLPALARRSPRSAARIEHFVVLVRSVLDARKRVMLEVNVPADRLEAWWRSCPACASRRSRRCTTMPASR